MLDAEHQERATGVLWQQGSSYIRASRLHTQAWPGGQTASPTAFPTGPAALLQ